MKGPTNRSSNCAENFRRTNAAIDSSVSGGDVFPRISRRNVNLVPQLNNPDVSNASESGTFTSLQLIKIYRGAPRGVSSTCSVSSNSLQSSASSDVALKLCGPSSNR